MEKYNELTMHMLCKAPKLHPIFPADVCRFTEVSEMWHFVHQKYITFKLLQQFAVVYKHLACYWKDGERISQLILLIIHPESNYINTDNH